MDDLTSEQAKPKRTGPARPPRPKTMQTTNNVPSTVQRHYEELSDFREERVRWFYYENKKWSAFCGQDSLKIERCFRCLPMEEAKTLPDSYEVCTVLGGLYDADVARRICTPVYWKADPLKICRGTWFKGSSSETHWVPISEEEATSIEQSHQTLWRSMGINPGVPHSNTASNTTATINNAENKNGNCLNPYNHLVFIGGI